jgi:hypothetical protein
MNHWGDGLSRVRWTLPLAAPPPHLARGGGIIMTATYGFGFDFAQPRSRRARIARIDALATMLDTAFVIPGASVRFGLDEKRARSSSRRISDVVTSRPTASIAA